MNQGKHTVLVAYGTRPEAIKLAPVVRELRKSPWLQPVVAVSGQDRQVLDQVNQLFGITSDVDLDIIEPGQSLTQVTARALGAYSDLLSSQEIDAVIVQGDTTTAMAAALAGFYAQLPVVHVEAGLRTGCFYSPFPEEVNRRLISQLASLHLAPTWMSRANLLEEGVYPADVTVTGNTVIDALTYAASEQQSTGDAMVEDAMAFGRPILLVTARDREAWDAGLAAIVRAVAAIAQARPELLVVLSMHAGPTVRARLLPSFAGMANVRVLEPMSYGPFSYLLSRSAVVLTDSGGIQEEAPSFGVPVLVTRDTTERPEAVDAGAAKLVGSQTGTIVHAVQTLLDHRPGDGGPALDPVSPFGDGRAAARTRAAIEELLGVGRRLAEFATVAHEVEEAKAS
ncbi:non-hydrolyzing UDP-N-acetylglucosamine 2-epimerase [Phytoactinopolyspora endophytica]|uniref:non-hydrolyzing UDP-N-acetylglucosamine 2-epimerase n=1 Tax=Phytoactinopolyspora endophytica TaxID=1642495 RepID=UPI00101CC857|nr:UDP-N-acetylglucosamine 2-epimerase (non-hydrolyzing) [Phytoactinopolyspora endophytica]